MKKQEPVLWTIRLVIILAIFAAVLMSWPLWFQHSNFPAFPLFKFPVTLSFGINQLGIYLFLFVAFCLLIYPNGIASILLLLVFLLLISADQLRFQPWLYLYVLLLFPHGFLPTDQGKTQLIIYMRWILAGVYFWSGVHKLNPYFELAVFKALLQFFTSAFLNTSSQEKLAICSYLVPLGEIMIACCLLSGFALKQAKWVAITMHILLIVYLGPWGINYNTVVIPWNLTMVILLLLLVDEDKNELKIDFGVFRKPVLLFGLVLVWLMPVFNFCGLWDHYPSFSLYSGKVNALFIKLPEKELSKADAFKAAVTYGVYANQPYVNVNTWCLAELNVPFYPAERLVPPLKLWLSKNKIEFEQVCSCPIQRIDSNCSKVE